ncbi:endonuclease/exonuclease/phosphatase family protein [soil metagenome]
MAFRKKASSILALKPDILIIPECECPQKLNFEEGLIKPTNILWFGNNQHKGLGIFSYGNYRLKPIKDHNESIKMVVPIAVSGGDYNFSLFAIWANNPADPDGQYVEQIWKALSQYKSKIKSTRTMLIGDFNSNTIWDRKSRIGNHSTVVEVLESKKILSTYHLLHKQIQGKEKHPTFYLYRHENKPYHLDYCFVSTDMAEKLESVKIGNHKTWSKYSDHVPLIVNFKFK